MPLIRAVIPLGFVVFGAVAAFMGGVVLLTSLRSGEISSGGQSEIVTVRRATDPSVFWWKVGLLGIAPALIGLGCAIGGWRSLRN